jgi:hypothetical protein
MAATVVTAAISPRQLIGDSSDQGTGSAGGRLLLRRHATSRAHRDIEVRSGRGLARPLLAAALKARRRGGPSRARPSPGPAARATGRPRVAASLATRAGRPRRLRLLPWQASCVPHRGRPGCQRGSHSRRASGCASASSRSCCSCSCLRSSPGLREMRTAPAPGPGPGDGGHPACPGLKVVHLCLHGIALVCIPWWPPPWPVSSAWRTGFPSSLRVSGCDRLHPGMYSPHRPAGHHRSRPVRGDQQPAEFVAVQRDGMASPIGHD